MKNNEYLQFASGAHSIWKILIAFARLILLHKEFTVAVFQANCVCHSSCIDSFLLVLGTIQHSQIKALTDQLVGDSYNFKNAKLK